LVERKHPDPTGKKLDNFPLILRHDGVSSFRGRPGPFRGSFADWLSVGLAEEIFFEPESLRGGRAAEFVPNVCRNFSAAWSISEFDFPSAISRASWKPASTARKTRSRRYSKKLNTTHSLPLPTTKSSSGKFRVLKAEGRAILGQPMTKAFGRDGPETNNLETVPTIQPMTGIPRFLPENLCIPDLFSEDNDRRPPLHVGEYFSGMSRARVVGNVPGPANER
jgi:hypothetical protein